MEYIKNLFKKTGWISMIESIIFAIFAIILIFNPDSTLNIIADILGVVFIVFGISKIINYFLSKGKLDFYNYDLIFGIMATIIGIVTIVCSESIANVFRIIIGIWIIYSALIRVSFSLKLKSMNNTTWVYTFTLAIVMLLCGLYVALNSVSIIGAFMLVYAIIDIIENIIFMKNVKELL